MLRWVESHDLTAEIGTRRDLLRGNPNPSLEQWLPVTPQTTRDLLASFQRTVIEELLRRATASAESYWRTHLNRLRRRGLQFGLARRRAGRPPALPGAISLARTLHR